MTEMVVDGIKGQLEKMRGEFTKQLPKGMPTERFVRTILTAVQINPDLMVADRKSLILACMKAAQDGLMPDGREGALVVYNTKVKAKNAQGREVETWVKTVQWLRM